jgi:hypothetical protein
MFQMTPMQSTQLPSSYTAFAGVQRIAAGDLPTVVSAVKTLMDQGSELNLLIFDDASAESIEADYRGSLEAVLNRLPKPVPQQADEPMVDTLARLPGRPKLGVVAREVTLMPRHWDWLATQPGGASVALRKLVEAASRANETKDRLRQAQEVAYRFMSTLAGNQPGYEEAVRALFAGNAEQFEQHTQTWPVDVRDYARRLALRVFAA